MRRQRWLLLAGLLALMPVAASAQSLVDLAKQEEARRRVAKPGKRLTNADLLPDTRTSAPPAIVTAPAAAPAIASGNASPPEPAATAAPPADTPVNPASEVTWRAQAVGHRGRIAKSQADVNALTGAAHADPRMQARAEALLKQAQGPLARAEAAYRQFQLNAANAKIPVAWIQ